MTKGQSAFLTFLSQNYFNQSVWLAADGKPATTGMQRLTIFEVASAGKSVRIDADELRPIRKLYEFSVTANALVLTMTGRRALEGVG